MTITDGLKSNLPYPKPLPMPHTTERALLQLRDTHRVLLEKLEPLVVEYGATKVSTAVDTIQAHAQAQEGVVTAVKRILSGAQLTDETAEALQEYLDSLVVATP